MYRRLAAFALVAAGLAAAPSHVKAGVIVVNTTEDRNATCNLSCSLREAIKAANLNADADVIQLPAGTYILSNADGDLDITSEVTIAPTGPVTIAGGPGWADRIFETSAPVSISNMTITRGFAQGDGGAISNTGVLNLTDVSVVDNISTGHGGGIYDEGSLSIIRGAVSRNTAGGNGGGIVAVGTTAVLRSVAVHGNLADSAGGILAQADAFDIDGSVITSNEATTVVGGGGIAHVAGQLDVIRTTIADNITSGSGGGIHTASIDGDLNVAESAIVRNVAAADGGGVLITSADAEQSMKNTTLSGNRAGGNGGGIHSTNGDVALWFVTVAFNRSDTANAGTPGGGGVSRASGPFSIAASVLSNNQDGIPPTDPECLGTFTDGGHNIEQTASPSCPGGSVMDAGLFPLGNYGGPTESHLLLSTSVRDFVPVATPLCGATATDQRGIARPQGAGCSVGALEITECNGRPVNIYGTGASETIYGTPSSDAILALGGNDVVHGGAGIDTICGGRGNDKLFGDADDDFIDGSGGSNDRCFGGPDTTADTFKRCEHQRQD
jgi:CSLREA domain-containing protein